MPTVTVQFLFDFGSPNTYLCHKLIPDIEVRTGASDPQVAARSAEPASFISLAKLTG